MKYRLLAIGLLLVHFALMTSTLTVTSATVDEPLHIVRGYAFALRGDDRLRLRGPLLPNDLSGLALRLEPRLQLPAVDDPIWADTEGQALAFDFAWRNAVSPQAIIFLARLPIVFVGTILGAFVFRWAAQRSGAAAAVGALLFYALCPNLLAHARLATADFVTAVTFFVAAYAFDRTLANPHWWTRLGSGLALGLALASKVSALVLPVAFLIQAFVHLWPERRSHTAWITACATILTTCFVAALTVWAVYGFTLAPIEAGGLPLPAPSYWGEWQALVRYLQGNVLPGYLWGEVSERGWWYYYPIAFLVKTPLPVLLMLVLIIGRAWVLRAWRSTLSLWLAPGLLAISLLFSPHDIGYRYLLPLLPFVFVASADVIAMARTRPRWRWGVRALLAWQVVGTLLIYPYFLAYFNELAGGPAGGAHILSDSNIDWGQDLVSLKRYMTEHQLNRLRFAYFGSAPPSAYDLHIEPLPPILSNVADQGAWWLHAYYPPDPAPGFYAISVLNVTRGPWFNPHLYDAFRQLQPSATVGHSINLYDVPARGTPADLSLAGLQIEQIDPETYRQFGTNDVRPRWFDATSSLIAAPGETWIAVADDQLMGPELAPMFVGIEPIARAKLSDEDRAYALYHFDLMQHMTAAAQRATPLPAKFGDTAELLSYELQRDGQNVSLVTYWRAGGQVVTPLQMFVHALGPDGSIVAQQDRLDAPAFGWPAGDVIAQVHRLHLPADRSVQQLMLGLYNLDTNQRLPVQLNGQSSDRLPLGALP